MEATDHKRKQEEFWMALINKYEKRNAALEQQERSLQLQLHQKAFSKNEPEETTCSCSPCLTKKDVEENSVFSLASDDLHYMSQIKELVDQEKEMKKKLELLQKNSLQGYDNTFKEDEFKECKCETSYDLSNNLLEENKRLTDELQDLKLEMKQCIEKIEGPITRQVEKEKTKNKNLEDELLKITKNATLLQQTLTAETNELKFELDDASKELSAVTEVNIKLQNAISLMKTKCAELEEALIDQKLAEAELLKKLKNVQSKQPQSCAPCFPSVQHPPSCICQCPLVRMLLSQEAAGDKSDSLLAIGKRLSTALKHAEQCPCCQSYIPQDLKDTCTGIKEIVNLLESKELKDSTPTSKQAEEAASDEKPSINYKPEESKSVPQSECICQTDEEKKKLSEVQAEPIMSENETEIITEKEENATITQADVIEEIIETELPEMQEATAEVKKDTTETETEATPDTKEIVTETATDKTEALMETAAVEVKSIAEKKSADEIIAEEPADAKETILEKSAVCSALRLQLEETCKAICSKTAPIQEKSKLNEEATIKTERELHKDGIYAEIDTKLLDGKGTDDTHVITTITGSGTLDVITEGPAGIIQTTLTYTDSGNVEILTEITEYEEEEGLGTLGLPEEPFVVESTSAAEAVEFQESSISQGTSSCTNATESAYSADVSAISSKITGENFQHHRDEENLPIDESLKEQQLLLSDQQQQISQQQIEQKQLLQSSKAYELEDADFDKQQQIQEEDVAASEIENVQIFETDVKVVDVYTTNRAGNVEGATDEIMVTINRKSNEELFEEENYDKQFGSKHVDIQKESDSKERREELKSFERGGRQQEDTMIEWEMVETNEDQEEDDKYEEATSDWQIIDFDEDTNAKDKELLTMSTAEKGEVRQKYINPEVDVTKAAEETFMESLEVVPEMEETVETVDNIQSHQSETSATSEETKDLFSSAAELIEKYEIAEDTQKETVSESVEFESLETQKVKQFDHQETYEKTNLSIVDVSSLVPLRNEEVQIEEPTVPKIDDICSIETPIKELNDVTSSISRIKSLSSEFKTDKFLIEQGEKALLVPWRNEEVQIEEPTVLKIDDICSIETPIKELNDVTSSTSRIKSLSSEFKTDKFPIEQEEKPSLVTLGNEEVQIEEPTVPTIDDICSIETPIKELNDVTSSTSRIKSLSSEFKTDKFPIEQGEKASLVPLRNEEVQIEEPTVPTIDDICSTETPIKELNDATSLTSRIKSLSPEFKTDKFPIEQEEKALMTSCSCRVGNYNGIPTIPGIVSEIPGKVVTEQIGPVIDTETLKKDVADALMRANKHVLDALDDANKHVMGALETANRDVNSALDALEDLKITTTIVEKSVSKDLAIEFVPTDTCDAQQQKKIQDKIFAEVEAAKRAAEECKMICAKFIQEQFSLRTEKQIEGMHPYVNTNEDNNCLKICKKLFGHQQIDTSIIESEDFEKETVQNYPTKKIVEIEDASGVQEQEKYKKAEAMQIVVVDTIGERLETEALSSLQEQEKGKDVENEITQEQRNLESLRVIEDELINKEGEKEMESSEVVETVDALDKLIGKEGEEEMESFEVTETVDALNELINKESEKEMEFSEVTETVDTLDELISKEGEKEMESSEVIETVVALDKLINKEGEKEMESSEVTETVDALDELISKEGEEEMESSEVTETVDALDELISKEGEEEMEFSEVTETVDALDKLINKEGEKEMVSFEVVETVDALDELIGKEGEEEMESFEVTETVDALDELINKESEKEMEFSEVTETVDTLGELINKEGEKEMESSEVTETVDALDELISKEGEKEMESSEVTETIDALDKLINKEGEKEMEFSEETETVDALDELISKEGEEEMESSEVTETVDALDKLINKEGEKEMESSEVTETVDALNFDEKYELDNINFEITTSGDDTAIIVKFVDDENEEIQETIQEEVILIKDYDVIKKPTDVTARSFNHEDTTLSKSNITKVISSTLASGEEISIAPPVQPENDSFQKPDTTRYTQEQHSNIEKDGKQDVTAPSAQEPIHIKRKSYEEYTEDAVELVKEQEAKLTESQHHREFEQESKNKVRDLESAELDSVKKSDRSSIEHSTSREIDKVARTQRRKSSDERNAQKLAAAKRRSTDSKSGSERRASLQKLTKDENKNKSRRSSTGAEEKQSRQSKDSDRQKTVKDEQLTSCVTSSMLKLQSTPYICECPNDCECEICAPEKMAEKIKRHKAEIKTSDDCTCLPNCQCAVCTTYSLEQQKLLPSGDQKDKEIQKGSTIIPNLFKSKSSELSERCHPLDCSCVSCLCDPCKKIITPTSRKPCDSERCYCAECLCNDNLMDVYEHPPECYCIECLCEICPSLEKYEAYAKCEAFCFGTTDTYNKIGITTEQIVETSSKKSLENIREETGKEIAKEISNQVANNIVPLTEENTEKIELPRMDDTVHTEDCTCPICQCPGADLVTIHKKPHDLNCQCPECLCDRSPGVDTQTLETKHDETDKDVVPDKQSVSNVLNEKPLSQCLEMTDALLQQKLLEMEEENNQRKQEMNELKALLDQMRCACANMDSIPRPQVQKAALETTMSGLQTTLANLQEKCKIKDQMIEALTKELRLRANSKVFNEMLKNLATDQPTNIDYDRLEICATLPRPKDKLQKCEHPDFPNCPCVSTPLAYSLPDHTSVQATVIEKNQKKLCEDAIKEENCMCEKSKEDSKSKLLAESTKHNENEDCTCSSCQETMKSSIPLSQSIQKTICLCDDEDLSPTDAPAETNTLQNICLCAEGVVHIDLNPLEIIEARQVAPDSLLLKWMPPQSKLVTGYEIDIDGVLKSRVHSTNRTSAIVHGLMFNANISIELYAISKHGRCLPPAHVIFPAYSC